MARARKKVWKLDAEAKAGMEVTSESATMAAATASHPNAVRVDKNGVTIAGPISIQTNPSEIRIGGFWVQQNPFMQMMPSTMATPIPALILNPPISGILQKAEAVAWAMTFLI